MFTKSLRLGFVGLVLSVATAWAGPSAIQGVVNDAKGQVIKGADVRIESKDGSKLFKTVKTDANGRYVSDGLAAGMYRVTLVVNGAVKASINNTKTKADQPTQLNFDLKPAPAAQANAAAKSGKHKEVRPLAPRTSNRSAPNNCNGRFTVQRVQRLLLKVQKRSFNPARAPSETTSSPIRVRAR